LAKPPPDVANLGGVKRSEAYANDLRVRAKNAPCIEHTCFGNCMILLSLS